jgi:hypothetical protein
MDNLSRKHFNENGANKYHIDCSKLEKNLESIEVSINNVIQNTHDITVLKSVLNDNIITSQHHNIVIKIGKINKTIEKEFMIGKQLEKEKIIGFINYICLFFCFDNTYINIKQNRHQNILPPICSVKNTDDQKKLVLIMPFIPDGSIRKFNWTNDNFDILKSVLQQTVMSIFSAYEKCGFIHGDLHLDNILLKKTKKSVITYEQNIEIKTYGYKIIIMDFDSSFINIDIMNGIEFYWLNLYNMLSRVNSDLGNSNDDKVSMNNMSKITSFIETQRINKKSYKNTLKLLDLIKDSSFIIIQSPKQNLVYNPNIFN